MRTNVSSVDKTIRIVLGIALFSLYFTLEGNARYFSLIGLIPFFTGLLSSCPLYSIFGISTCQTEKADN